MAVKIVKVLAERKNKTIYRDGDRVIKLFEKKHPKSNILNEALNQARVEEATDLNIPKLLEVTKIKEGWALVSEYVSGTTLSELMEKHPEKEDEYLELFVKLQLEVLSKRVPLLSRMKDKFSKKLKDTNLIDDATKYELEQRLDGMKNHAKLCHGDFNPSNIIITEKGNAYVLDWSHATQGNASGDAARTFLLFSIQGKEELADKYLEMFAEKSGIEKTHIRRWIPIVAATQLTKGIKEEQEFLSSWINVVDFG